MCVVVDAINVEVVPVIQNDDHEVVQNELVNRTDHKYHHHHDV